MCQVIVVDKGDKEIESPRQFLEHFGITLDVEEDGELADGEESVWDCCLCNYDLDAIFQENNIPFVVSSGDYFVGDIEGVKPGWD
jgi:hypothetical protein